MKYWIEYASSGQIYFSGASPELPPPQRGGTVIEVPFMADPLRMVFIGDELYDAGPQPSPMHVLDYETGEWHKWVPPDVAIAQQLKWDEIKAKREALTFGGFEWSGYVFDSDIVSDQKIAGAAQLAQLAITTGAPFQRTWTLKDNSKVSLNAQEMIAVMLAMGEHVGTTHDIGTMLREQIYAPDATVESVSAIEWPATTAQ